MAVHENSLANLKPNRKGSKPKYEELKKQRSVTVTEVGWNSLKSYVKEEFDLSVSELLEHIGRGEFKIVKSIDAPHN